jgi:type VI protein secretion system component VasF
MLEVRDPGLLAAAIELDLERFERAGTIVRMPAAMTDLARTLGRIAVMLREAEQRQQAVDLGDEVVRLIQQFRNALRTVGGAPAEA